MVYSLMWGNAGFISSSLGFRVFRVGVPACLFCTPTLRLHVPIPKGPRTQNCIYFGLNVALCRYFRANVYTIWVHGPL